MNRNKREIISIIVPVYNGEKHIKMCLDSLLNQDVDEELYEIICINDGSTDESLVILRDYEKRFANLRVVDKPNGGVSAARNTGLKMSRGEYVWFIDADDWIARNCLGVIMEQLQEYTPSVLQVQFDWIKAQWRIDDCAEALLNHEKIDINVNGAKSMEIVGAWSSIINKALLFRYDLCFFEHLHYGEDVLFIRELFDRMRIEEETKTETHITVHCVGDIFYYYRLHNESACRSSWTKNREKYTQALLELAQINQEKMQDKTKPMWYREKYEGLFYKRIYNYMMNWLPGNSGDLKKQLTYLKEKGLYPCPTPPKAVRQEWLKAESGVGKIKAFYKYVAFRCKWMYKLFYKQMRKKYIKVEKTE